jgi:aminoglycoside phosphotransferase (APT) family kinase protein
MEVITCRYFVIVSFMNPDTKLTLEQLQLICRRHNIPHQSHSRINSGFSHEVHRLNDDLVIKLFNTKDSRRFDTESAVLASTANFPKPKLIASNGPTEEIDRSYIIMTYVPGASLGTKWHLATDVQRENLVKEISKALRTINQINPSDIALKAEDSWEVSVLKGGQEQVTQLKNKNIIDAPTADKVIETLAKSSAALANSKTYSVYWDIHFDNFIVNDNFELQALIDLENVELASLDYPLFVIQKQTDVPEKYLREEDEKYADKKDYAKLKDWYRQYYPEMFDFDNLDTRLKVYQLLDTLNLLADWPHVKDLHAKLHELVA